MKEPMFDKHMLYVYGIGHNTLDEVYFSQPKKCSQDEDKTKLPLAVKADICMSDMGTH